ncbi:MAG: type III-B CRISPR module RAMP protein Cmr4 [Acidobacteriota bacterium]
MKFVLLGLLAETPIHPGSGRSAGFVDLPVAREAATDYPVIVGSSVKGALLDLARTCRLDNGTRERVFGEQDQAGSLLVSDARLVLLPVRSLKSQYKWVTCPHLVERLLRDLSRGGAKPPVASLPPIDRGTYQGPADGTLFLEEREFTHAGTLLGEILAVMKGLILHEGTAARLEQQLVIVHDDDFVWFARYGLSVNARNVLDEKKTSTNLWYEETIPPDTLFSCLLAERSNDGAIKSVTKLFENRPYLQMGGNETVGHGWFAVKFPEVAEGGEA